MADLKLKDLPLVSSRKKDFLGYFDDDSLKNLDSESNSEILNKDSCEGFNNNSHTDKSYNDLSDSALQTLSTNSISNEDSTKPQSVLKQPSIDNTYQAQREQILSLVKKLRSLKHKLDPLRILEQKLLDLTIKEGDFKNKYLLLAKNLLYIISDVFFTKVPVNFDKLFLSLQQEIDSIDIQEKIVIKVNPKSIELYQNGFEKSNIYTKYKNRIEFLGDNNVTLYGCYVFCQNLSLYFDNAQLKSLVTDVLDRFFQEQ